MRKGTVIICMFCFCSCYLNSAEKKEVVKLADPSRDSIDYKLQVQPILEKNCSPCHFPGGKLYEKLPFDRGETIIDHERVVLKRLKNENELSLIKQYIKQNRQD